MLTKDYFRRISWIELFGYKINEKGNYIDEDSVSHFMTSSKSISVYANESKSKQGRDRRSTPKKDHFLREPNKIQFYSEKYVDLLSRSMGQRGI